MSHNITGAYTLSGFQEYGTIPINFPTDLCLFDINSVLYAAALHQPAANVLNQTYLSVFRNFGSVSMKCKYQFLYFPAPFPTTHFAERRPRSAPDLQLHGALGAGHGLHWCRHRRLHSARLHRAR